jgi:hypothetical protein
VQKEKPQHDAQWRLVRELNMGVGADADVAFPAHLADMADNFHAAVLVASPSSVYGPPASSSECPGR